MKDLYLNIQKPDHKFELIVDVPLTHYRAHVFFHKRDAVQRAIADIEPGHYTVTSLNSPARHTDEPR